MWSICLSICLRGGMANNLGGGSHIPKPTASVNTFYQPCTWLGEFRESFRESSARVSASENCPMNFGIKGKKDETVFINLKSWQSCLVIRKTRVGLFGIFLWTMKLCMEYSLDWYSLDCIGSRAWQGGGGGGQDQATRPEEAAALPGTGRGGVSGFRWWDESFNGDHQGSQRLFLQPQKW